MLTNNNNIDLANDPISIKADPLDIDCSVWICIDTITHFIWIFFYTENVSLIYIQSLINSVESRLNLNILN